MAKPASTLSQILDAHEQDILSEWLRALAESGAAVDGSELQGQCRDLLGALQQAIRTGELTDIHAGAFAPARELLVDISRSRAAQGFSPSETAMFLFSLKQPLFELLRQEHRRDAEALGNDTWALSLLLDRLGLFTNGLHCPAGVFDRLKTGLAGGRSSFR